MGIVDFKLRDVYTGTLIRLRSTEDLKDWLVGKYATLMPEQLRCIEGLCAAFESGEDPTWWAAACGIHTEPLKKARKQ